MEIVRCTNCNNQLRVKRGDSFDQWHVEHTTGVITDCPKCNRSNEPKKERYFFCSTKCYDEWNSKKEKVK